MSAKRKDRGAQPEGIAGAVRWFSAEEGWGVIDAPQAPGGCFVHFSAIDAAGYRTLRAGQQVWFTCEQPGQDGCAYRATRVWLRR